MYARIERTMTTWLTRHGAKLLASLYLLLGAVLVTFAVQVYDDARESGNPMVGVVGGVTVAFLAAIAIASIASSWED